jgi:hypothetical protein
VEQMFFNETTHKQKVKSAGNISKIHLPILLLHQNNTCGCCKKELRFPSKGNFDIHHKDRNRENNDISNLIVLCKPCHKKEHKKRWDTILKERLGYTCIELKDM